MSDNVSISSGSGTPIRTKNSGGIHYQYVLPTGASNWTKNHAPAAAAQATVAQAAAGAGIKNVCMSISVSLASAAAPTVGVVTFNLRDGATGAGTILWTVRLSLPAVSDQAVALSVPVWIEGTANTAMTLETSAAPAANVQATVAMTGTSL